MRAVVYGTGGAGGYFGAQLALSGEQVTFVARGDHLKALRANGLRLETPKGDTVICPVEATDDPATVTSADGISRPSVFAALRLITNSNVVGCQTGKSPGLSPLRMRPT